MTATFARLPYHLFESNPAGDDSIDAQLQLWSLLRWSLTAVDKCSRHRWMERIAPLPCGTTIFPQASTLLPLESCRLPGSRRGGLRLNLSIGRFGRLASESPPHPPWSLAQGQSACAYRSAKSNSCRCGVHPSAQVACRLMEGSWRSRVLACLCRVDWIL